MQPNHAHTFQKLLACALLAAITIATYWPVRRCDFVHLDDPEYVTQNPAVLKGLDWESAATAFRADQHSNWHPLTWLSHMLDVQMFGVRPAPHHWVNVAFHVANALLLLLVLSQMTGAVWRCAFIAGLFAVHPLHVESVAWVAERKDVLSTFFGLLALGAYAKFAMATGGSLESRVSSLKSKGQRPPSATYSPSYWVALLFFALSLLCKPTLVTLPFLLLLLDFWPLRRLQIPPGAGLKDLLEEKVPFLFLATGSCAVTLWMQKQAGALRPLDILPFGARVANAVLGYVSYLARAFWPVDLVVIYPLPHQRPAWEIAGAAFLITALTLGALLLWRRRCWLVGWLWFLGLLVPMIGLVQVGDQAIADRYTYLPLVGIFLALTWGICELWPSGRLRGAVFAAGGLAILAACATLTWRQLAFWQNTGTLMRHTLALTKDNYIAYDNLGSFYLDSGESEAAAENFRKSLAIIPRLEALNNLGLALASQGKFTNAIPYFEAAVRSNPEVLSPRLNLADTLAAAGRLPESAAQYREALRRKPNSAPIHHELGFVLAHLGKTDEALEHYYAALRIQPEFPEARNSLAMTLSQAGRLDEAISQYRLVLHAHPSDLETHNNLGIALTYQGKLDEAIAQFHEVLRLDTNHASAFGNLGNALAAKGQSAEAMEAFRAFIRLSPNDPRAHQGLAQGLFEQGQLDDALAELQIVLRLQPQNPDAHYRTAQILDRQGKQAEAIAQLNEALRLRPDFPDARKQLEAVAVFRRAQKMKRPFAGESRQGSPMGQVGRALAVPQ